MDECDSSSWRSLPLASVVNADDYDPSSVSYWQDNVIKQLIPAIVFCSLAAAMLLGYVTWRLVRACTRGRQRRIKEAAAAVLVGRVYWGLKITAVLVAAGVIAAAGVGISRVDPSLVDGGWQAVDAAEAYVREGLVTANATVAAVQDLDTWMLGIQVKLSASNISRDLLSEINSAITSVHEQIQGSLGSVRSTIGYLQVRLLDRLTTEHLRWSATVTIADVARQAVLYTLFALLILAAAFLAFGVAFNCPSAASPALILALCTLVLSWALVGGSTAGLKVGNDGCQNVNQLIVDGLRDQAAKQQDQGGGGLFARAGVNNTVALANYYLTGQGKNITEVILDVTGLDIDHLLALANNTVAGVAAMVGNAVLQAQLPALANLSAPVRQLDEGVQALADHVAVLEAQLSYAQFAPVYAAVKSYGCCQALDWLAGLWAVLLAAGCCLVVLASVLFWWVARMDRLEPRGCWHIYRVADYASMEEGEEEEPPPELPADKPSEDKVFSEIRELSLTKQQQLSRWQAPNALEGAGAFSLRAVHTEDAVLLHARGSPTRMTHVRSDSDVLQHSPYAPRPSAPPALAYMMDAAPSAPSAPEEQQPGSARSGRRPAWVRWTTPFDSQKR